MLEQNVFIVFIKLLINIYFLQIKPFLIKNFLARILFARARVCVCVCKCIWMALPERRFLKINILVAPLSIRRKTRRGRGGEREEGRCSTCMHIAWKRASPRKHDEGFHLSWGARARPTFPRRRRLVHLLVWTSPPRVKVNHSLPARCFYRCRVQSTTLLCWNKIYSCRPIRAYCSQSSRHCSALIPFVSSLEIPLLLGQMSPI